MYARLRCGGNLPLRVRGLGTKNGPRSEVIRHKKRVTSKSIKTL